MMFTFFIVTPNTTLLNRPGCPTADAVRLAACENTVPRSSLFVLLVVVAV